MPRGKAPLVGVPATWVHERTLPEGVGDPQLLLRWRQAKLPQTRAEQRNLWRQRTRDALARYLAFKAGTSLLTTTERERRIRKSKGNPDALRDINSRVIADRRRRWSQYDPKYQKYNAPGQYWVDPLLPDLIHELVATWKEATGRLAGTRDPDRGEFPFYEWIADLFQSCGKEPPKEGTVRDIFARLGAKKSGP